MCTCIIAGRKTTASGNVLFGANDDWDGVPGLLTHVPRAHHAPGETWTLVGGLKIPEVPETLEYSYTACRYSIGTLDRGWAGGMNEKGVAVAGTGVCAFKPIPWEGLGLEPDDVQLLLLRRARSAREGVRLIGELIERYGMRPSAMEGCGSAATYMIADAQEGWVLETAPGRAWVAVRVPDDEVAVRENAFGTHCADLTDPENTMASPTLSSYARERGWWDGDDACFDFANVYGAETSPCEWGPELDPMNMRRRWRAMELFSGRAQDEGETLYSVRPDRRLSKVDLMMVLSDVYEGTPYDLSKTPSAGRYGDPFADDTPSYALCRRGTISSIVAEPERGILWTAMATPKMSFYIPVFADIAELPDCCDMGEPMGERESLFWEFKELCLLTQRRYCLHMPITARARSRYAAESEECVRRAEELMASLPEEEKRRTRTELTRERIEAALALCRDTRRELLLQY